jgi:PPOX class probable F420-dependent enzyme
MAAVIDERSEFGTRVARHLREELIVWLTTVTPGGAPLPMPVWFRWDGAESVVVYSVEGARTRNLESNPRVALNFRGDREGWDTVVISGTAVIDRGAPAADRDRDYLAKYGDHLPSLGMTPAAFAHHYSVPVRIRLGRVRGH